MPYFQQSSRLCRASRPDCGIDLPHRSLQGRGIAHLLRRQHRFEAATPQAHQQAP